VGSRSLCSGCLRRLGGIVRALDAKGVGDAAKEAAGSLWAYHAALAGVRSRPITRARRRVYRAVYDRLVAMGASRLEVATLLETNVQTIQLALDEC